MTRDRDKAEHRNTGWTLVTGAARGIGRAFAEELARDGRRLLLVDSNQAELAAAAESLRRHGAQVVVIAQDLTAPGLEEAAHTWMSQYDVDLLVNNAGVSAYGTFFDIPLERHLNALDLNCRATLVLTHIVGAKMIERRAGGIIVVSSASALSGSPLFASYAATKGFGLNLGAGLWAELEGSGVEVLTVCPGLVDTSPVRELLGGKKPPSYVPFSKPSRVARAALRRLGRQPVLVPTWADHLTTALVARLLPLSWSLRLTRRTLLRMMPGAKE